MDKYFEVSSPVMLKDMILKYVEMFENQKISASLKASMKAELRTFFYLRLTIYWTRPAVGIFCQTTGKDVGYISCAGATRENSWTVRLAACMKTAEMLAYYVDCLIKDLLICPEGIPISPEVHQMKEALRQAMLDGLANMAELGL